MSRVLRVLFACCPLVCASVALAADHTIEGFSEPFRRIDLAAAEPGILTKLFVSEGERVRAGQLLAQLDRDVLEISAKIAEQAKASRGRLQAATAERDQREQRLQRLRQIEPKRFASVDEIARAETELTIAEANVLAAQEQLAIDALEFDKAQALLDRRSLRSPIAGVVTKLHREEREFVNIINPTIITVVQLHPLRVIFPVPTTAALGLAADQSVKITIPELKQEAVGRVELISPVTEAESGTVRVKVLIDNPEGKYRSGVRCVLNAPGSTPPPLASAR